MKKILLSIFAIALTVGLVSGTAYALFSDTVNVAGITMTSGNADLKITDPGTGWLVSGGTYTSFLSTNLSNFYPGKIDATWMDFKNQSKSDIDLALSAQITATGGNWEELKNKIELAIVDDTYSMNGTQPQNTDFHPLSWWTVNRSFGSNLKPGKTTQYRLFIRVVGSAGNEMVGKSLSDMTITFTGTQANKF